MLIRWSTPAGRRAGGLRSRSRRATGWRGLDETCDRIRLRHKVTLGRLDSQGFGQALGLGCHRESGTSSPLQTVGPASPARTAWFCRARPPGRRRRALTGCRARPRLPCGWTRHSAPPMTHVDVRHPTAPTATMPLLEEPKVRRIQPTEARIRLADLYRDLPVIQVLAARDFKVKYKQSLLGPLWLVFQPLALLAAFFVAFRGLADVQAGVPYTVFALVGLSGWTFFQASMTIGAASLVSSVTLIRFTPCPRLAFPIAGIVASLPAWAVATAGALGAAAVTGTLSPRALLLPLGLVWLCVLTWGLVAIAAPFTARFRDMLAALPFLLQVGVFLAPVGYPLYALNSTARVLVDLNPLTGLIETLRWMVIAGYSPSFEPI